MTAANGRQLPLIAKAGFAECHSLILGKAFFILFFFAPKLFLLSCFST
jgi:hypothetical protein